MEAIDKVFLLLSCIWKPKLLLSLLILVIVRSIWVAKRSKVFISWPVCGMLPSYILALRSGFHAVITDILHNQNGTFTLTGPWFCNFENVITSDPRNVEYTLKTNFYNFRKGHSANTIMRDLLGESFFSRDGAEWRSVRKLIATNIFLADFNKLATETFVELVQNRLLPVTDNFVKQSAVFDLQALLSRLFFDQSCSIALGVDPGYLTPSLPTVQFANAFKRAEEVTALRFFTPMVVWKLMKYFNLGAEKEMKSCTEQINDFAYNLIKTRKMERSTESGNTRSRSDFLSLLLEAKDDNGNCYPDKFVRDNCFNIIFAGSDTSALALPWFFWLLHQNPIAEKRIYAEICSMVGKTDDPSSTLRPDGVKKMHYLHAAISESLRLYPPVPLNHVEVHNNDELPSGIKLRKGVKVITSMYAMGRMESIWGEDCREFKPERWLSSDGTFVAVSQYKFPAFNAGLRNCVGKDLGYYQMKVLVASIIYRYRVKVVEDQTIVPRLSMNLHMKHGLKVMLSRRHGSESDNF